MADSENTTKAVATVEEIQHGWHDIASKVRQLESEEAALEDENKALRALLERVIEHRQKSHGELVLLLTSLVSKLPINDVGVLVAKLMEHNTNVCEACSAFSKGNTDTITMVRPSILKALEDTKRDLADSIKLTVEELIGLEAPLEKPMLESLVKEPDLFFSAPVIRASRCFLKGQVPRERVVREFGEEALVFFDDLTTDPKRNRNPKPEEILLGFKSDFETLFQQQPSLLGEKRDALMGLYRKVQSSRASTEQARAQKETFLKMSFVLELLHYYEHQNTEAPDVVFAQRLPAVVEQLVLSGGQDKLEEKSIREAEKLMAFVINADHRHAIANNVGKGGGLGRILKHVLRLRDANISHPDQAVTEFLRPLLPRNKPPQPTTVAAVLRFIPADRQRMVVYAIMESDRLPKEEAVRLGRAVAVELGLEGLEAPKKAAESLPPETERQIAWERIKELITRRSDPAAVAAAVRDRLHARYDADEIRQSWLVLIEGDPISFIRIFSQLPYTADGKTDPVARTVMQTYVTRLMHEKYASVYNKVVSSLRNMFKANPNSPTLTNFMTLVKWVDHEASNRLCADVGMAAFA